VTVVSSRRLKFWGVASLNTFIYSINNYSSVRRLWSQSNRGLRLREFNSGWRWDYGIWSAIILVTVSSHNNCGAATIGCDRVHIHLIVIVIYQRSVDAFDVGDFRRCLPMYTLKSLDTHHNNTTASEVPWFGTLRKGMILFLFLNEDSKGTS